MLKTSNLLNLIEEKIDKTIKANDEKIENVKQDLGNEMAKMHKISEYNQKFLGKNSRIVHGIGKRAFEDFKNLTKEDVIATLKSNDMEYCIQFNIYQLVKQINYLINELANGSKEENNCRN
ncbi:hypothetical protein BpHYR1_021680 [Brachionus plicatilis]|uniref:Uncharacterized protein n=1 Tax=Brachionus plicatilis TaxID=10195 RepID=A0A3M7RV74_BRAPC|nr:hypothetical protein BpHYR1_021680 [Brachionus plicatilis]